jgi:hypothetical protein
MEEKIEQAFTRKYLPQWLVVGGVALFVISSCVWWTQVYENSYNVWWGMLSNTLSESSVTSHQLETTTDGTKLDQYIGQQFGINTFAYGRTTLTTGTNVVKTETYGTLARDYVRYVGIRTSQKGSNGKPLNFSNLLGKWASSAVTNSSATGTTPFFTQTMLGVDGGNVVPMANLTADKRANLLTQLHQSTIFKTDYSKAKKGKLNGRPILTYSVDVEPVAYVAYEKAFAADMGIKALTAADPNNYQGEQAITMNFSVDVRSHQLVEVSNSGQKDTTYYNSFGVPISQSTPKATISSGQLESLLNEIK